MPNFDPLFATGQFKALVIGSNGALGRAFVEAFQSEPNCSHVEAVSRSAGSGFDLQDAESICAQAAWTSEKGPFEIIIDATGALVINGIGPEKSLQSVDSEHLMQSFLVNAIGPALVLRHFSQLLSPGASIYAKLSARVGSISDNQKGGWYGYRASKAALNMVLQTAALELQRKNKLLRVVALQPGTVKSKLSQPFVGSQNHILEPHESVEGMLRALRNLSTKSGAHFIDYKGNEIPW
ncbi:MAG: SDR family NAD(P)-dependent oxidoreductase [Burkholderiales bacterium]|jgi:NAD(P)-dependent dehydrogenase (short-subunit alcohol dehydrogenase family)|nr:SDR family NAD(P)-dependent oxidoreductase [Burkholderiales bacterium]